MIKQRVFTKKDQYLKTSFRVTSKTASIPDCKVCCNIYSARLGRKLFVNKADYTKFIYKLQGKWKISISVALECESCHL